MHPDADVSRGRGESGASPDDTELIARALARDDRHAFSELVRRHQSAVRGFLRRLSGERDGVADDLAQETFIEAYRHLTSYRGQAPFSTWLAGIACNRWRTYRRRCRATEEWTGDIIPAEAAAGYETAVPAGTVAADLRHDLRLALARLSDDEQAAILLCFHNDLTHEEAAIALDCPLGTVKTHLLRAKGKLRTYLRAWAPASP